MLWIMLLVAVGCLCRGIIALSRRIMLKKNGGSLYFYDSQVADDLKKQGYIVLYAKSGTKGTQFRPAWYIRPQ